MELRWLEVVTGRKINEQGKWEPTYTPKLQFRTKGLVKWSDWQDVPTVRENND